MASHSKHAYYLRPWHFDCRLSKELPDDTPVRGRFLANVLAATMAVVVIYYAAINLYAFSISRTEISYWQNHLQQNRAQLEDLQKVIASIQRGGRRLDDVHRLTHTSLPITEFIQEIGRSRPANIRIDMIEYHDNVVYIRGGLRESSQRTTAMLSQYVAELRANPRLKPLFSQIVQTSMERNVQASTHSFEIVLRLQTPAP
jgi:hypothetical protein